MSYLTTPTGTLQAQLIAALEGQGFAYNPLRTTFAQYLATALGEPTAYLHKSIAQMLSEIDAQYGGSLSHLRSSVAQLMDDVAANIGAGGGGGGYVAQAVHLGGSSQLVSNAPLAGITNAEKGLMSFWWKNAATTSDFAFMATTVGNRFELDWPWDPDLGAQDMILFLFNTDYDAFTFYPNTSFLAPGWMHFLFAWDAGHPSGEKVVHCVVNGQLIDHSILTIGDAFGPITVDYSGLFGVFGDPSGGSCPIGDSADWYFAPGQFLDMSIEANRLKFIDAEGKPVDLGADGSTPTGVEPAVFFSGDATGFATNKGTGGAFTVTGAITNASTSPSD